MVTFTSSLPEALIAELNKAAKKLNLPKNKLIERALEIYLDQLNRADYVKSFQQASHDKQILQIAEEGMEEYLTKLSEDEAR